MSERSRNLDMVSVAGAYPRPRLFSIASRNVIPADSISASVVGNVWLLVFLCLCFPPFFSCEDGTCASKEL
jgi:hypothetical protein